MNGRKHEFIQQLKNNNSVLKEIDELNSILFKKIASSAVCGVKVIA